MKQTKITKSAKGEECSLRIPGVCNFDPATTVFCHAPCADKGMGYKSPGWWGAYGCNKCHDYVDGRAGIRTVHLPADEAWLRGIYETQKKLIAKGLIKV